MDTPATVTSNTPLVPHEQINHFVGFDWASEKHDIVVVDRDGQTTLQLEFADDAQGWAGLRERLQNLQPTGKDIGVRSD